VDTIGQRNKKKSAVERMWIDFCEQVLHGSVGNEFDFYGAAENQFKLNDTVWEAIEDPDDGYRSHMDTVLVKPDSQTIFFKQPIARVSLERFEGMKEEDPASYSTEKVDNWILRDVADQHVWLTFGTDNTDDYYPYFVFRYEPKAEVAK